MGILEGSSVACSHPQNIRLHAWREYPQHRSLESVVTRLMNQVPTLLESRDAPSRRDLSQAVEEVHADLYAALLFSSMVLPHQASVTVKKLESSVH